MGVGAVIKLLDGFGVFRASNEFEVGVGTAKESFVRLGLTDTAVEDHGRRHHHASRRPAVTPAYLGVGYIIGPELGALNFAGGLLAWGLFVPLLVFFLGPTLIDQYLAANGGDEDGGLGARSSATSGGSSSGRSRSAACWSAPASRSSRCART